MKSDAGACEDVVSHKQQLRERFLRNRSEQTNGIDVSRNICDKLTGLPEYQATSTLSAYLSMPWEVQTLELVGRAWDDGKRVVVPCCTEDNLRLFHLQSLDELAPRTLGILEPRAEWRRRSERWLDVTQIGLFVVPGLVFDQVGGRLGHGKGYYDRLLANAQCEAVMIGLAFECQIIASVPMTPNDISMDYVITERMVYRRS